MIASFAGEGSLKVIETALMKKDAKNVNAFRTACQRLVGVLRQAVSSACALQDAVTGEVVKDFAVAELSLFKVSRFALNDLGGMMQHGLRLALSVASNVRFSERLVLPPLSPPYQS